MAKKTVKVWAQMSVDIKPKERKKLLKKVRTIDEDCVIRLDNDPKWMERLQKEGIVEEAFIGDSEILRMEREQDQDNVPKTVMEFLKEDGFSEREIPDYYAVFASDEDCLNAEVLEFFDDFYEVGKNYIEQCVGSLDVYIDQVLDLDKLGEVICNMDDEYIALSSGRVVRLEVE